MANAGTWRRRIVVLASAGAAVAITAPVRRAHADDRPDKQACVAAYEEAQQLRKDGKLTSSRARLLVCAQDSCPAVVRKDCTVWLAEVEQATPTVVLAARSPSGQDAVDVTVSLDGKPLAKRLDGKALPLDPGPHTFRFELPSAQVPAREETILLHEGERNRQVLADFQPPAAAPSGAAGAAAAPSSAPLPAPMRPAPTPVGAYVLGGLGVAGLGVFTAFGLLGLSAKSDLDARACRPGCPQGDVDAVKQKFLIADIGLGVGAVSLGIATVLYLARGEVPANEPSVALDVLPARGGAALGLRGAF
jgi:hypothetical protein